MTLESGFTTSSATRSWKNLVMLVTGSLSARKGSTRPWVLCSSCEPRTRGRQQQRDERFWPSAVRPDTGLERVAAGYVEAQCPAGPPRPRRSANSHWSDNNEVWLCGSKSIVAI